MKPFTVALLGLLVCVPTTAQRDILVKRIVARKQVALVIGNGAYTHVGQLKNPVNDAEAMGRKLQEAGFDVLLLKDGGRRAIGQKIEEFVGRLGTGDVGVFYYAGHGVQVEGENYLVPVDFDGNTETDVRYDAYAVGRIQERMERSGAQLNMLMLDACRSNPFRFGGRAGTRGWAPMNAGRGTFIAFATAPGSVASDNSDAPNGLFTQFLLEALSKPGLNLNEVFDYVRSGVDAASGSKQLPWTHSSVVGSYSFRPMSGALPPAERRRADTDAWESVRTSDSADLFEQFLKEYPDSQYAGAARIRLAALHGPAAAITKPPPLRPTPVSANSPVVKISTEEVTTRPTLRRMSVEDDGTTVTRPTVIYKEVPAYSAEAVKSKIEGSVELSILVEEGGVPRDITVSRSLDPYLDRIAVESMKSWLFTPGKKNGQPVAMKVLIDVDFKLPVTGENGTNATYRLGKIEISKFAGLVLGDTAEKATALFGKACSSQKNVVYFAAGCSAASTIATIMIPMSARVRPEIMVNLAAKRIVSITVWTLGKARADQSGTDPLIQLLGKTAADLVSALGEPTEATKDSWIWKVSGSSRFAQCSFTKGRCESITVHW